MDTFELLDLGFQGLQFTWQRGKVFERFDRAIYNDPWNSTFSHATVSHLPKIKSDHRPLRVDFRPDIHSGKRCSFRFLAGWVEHPTFSNFVKDNWSDSGSISMTHSSFMDKVKNWNKDVYGHITSRKKLLIRKLNNIQSALERTNSDYLHQLEMEVREELDKCFTS